MKPIYKCFLAFMAVASLSSCDSFLEEQIPQGTLSEIGRASCRERV